MPTLTADCPHCFTKNTFFKGLNAYAICEDAGYLTFQCQHCKNIVLTLVDDASNQSRRFTQFDFSLDANKIINGWEVLNIWPNFPKPKTLDYLPESVAKRYIEAQEQLAEGRFETAISICRKSLDIATVLTLEEKQAKDGEGNILTKEALVKRPLKRRIELLFENNLITKDMESWAHIIREDANDAIHTDIIFTKEEAQELLDFTEVFLMYLYTLPKMVEEKRKTN
ncbi:DUF4145 domain-containing protein [Entomomonas moraniae]|uniref:DUF4145 domain-containing protein n=1 Tax=Entomomonas moraniae TaxID=2213226 RepID=A0A3Q9JL41_9GAMM|nr:DUF4145 domain-containing protein [Entomomonas moraniae]AZS50057.1 DUF4145 domain-containing protein [Entomomonas moraniae]